MPRKIFHLFFTVERFTTKFGSPQNLCSATKPSSATQAVPSIAHACSQSQSLLCLALCLPEDTYYPCAARDHKLYYHSSAMLELITLPSYHPFCAFFSFPDNVLWTQVPRIQDCALHVHGGDHRPRLSICRPASGFLAGRGELALTKVSSRRDTCMYMRHEASIRTNFWQVLATLLVVNKTNATKTFGEIIRCSASREQTNSPQVNE